MAPADLQVYGPARAAAMMVAAYVNVEASPDASVPVHGILPESAHEIGQVAKIASGASPRWDKVLLRRAIPHGRDRRMLTKTARAAPSSEARRAARPEPVGGGQPQG